MGIVDVVGFVGIVDVVGFDGFVDFVDFVGIVDFDGFVGIVGTASPADVDLLEHCLLDFEHGFDLDSFDIAEAVEQIDSEELDLAELVTGQGRAVDVPTALFAALVELAAEVVTLPSLHPVGVSQQPTEPLSELSPALSALQQGYQFFAAPR